MHPTCPKCRDLPMTRLDGRATSASTRGESLRCSRCGGLWVVAVDLGRDDVARFDTPDAGRLRLAAANDERTGLCPYDHTILIAAQVPADPPLHLERCEACRGIFFDAGELQRTRATLRLAEVDRFWSPAVRALAHRDAHRRRYRERLIDTFGAAGLAVLEEAAAILATRDDSGMGVAYLLSLTQGRALPNPDPVPYHRPTVDCREVRHDDSSPLGCARCRHSALGLRA